MRILAEGLREHPEYKDYLSADYIADLVRSAPLHDIGKVGISDNILRKPGRLDTEELNEMKKHVNMAPLF